MEIWEGTSKLTDLKYERKKERRKLESNNKVKELQRSDVLFEKEMSFVLGELKAKKEEKEEILDKWNNLDDFNSGDIVSSYSLDLLITMKELVEGIDSVSLKDANNSPKRINQKIINHLIRLSDESEEIVYELKENYDFDLDFLETVSLYLCRSCNYLISTGSFTKNSPLECRCGREIQRPQDCEKRSIKMLEAEFSKIYQQDMLLEYSFERLLKKANMNTISGVYCLGISGIKHELDVVADSRSKNVRVLVECKSKKITCNDLMLFNQKCQELGCDIKIFVAIGEIASDREKRFAKSEDILLVENFYEQNPNELLERIKSKLDTKSL